MISYTHETHRKVETIITSALTGFVGYGEKLQLNLSVLVGWMDWWISTDD